MKNRVCRLFFEIDQHNSTKRYSLAPLSPEELSTGFVAGFRVTGITDDPQPVYLVRVRPNGVTHCTCPAFHWEAAKGQQPTAPPLQPDPTCKHCEALAATGAVTRSMLDVLKERTKLLDAAEQRIQQMAKNREIETEAACRNTDSLRKDIVRLESELHQVRQRALQLQDALAVETTVPKRRSRKKVAA